MASLVVFLGRRILRSDNLEAERHRKNRKRTQTLPEASPLLQRAEDSYCGRMPGARRVCFPYFPGSRPQRQHGGRWISEARRAGHMPAPPGFVPISLPAVRPAPEAPIVPDQRHIIRIEIPRAGGAVVVEWPVEQAHQCAVLLRALLE